MIPFGCEKIAVMALVPAFISKRRRPSGVGAMWTDIYGPVPRGEDAPRHAEPNPSSLLDFSSAWGIAGI